MAASPLYSYTCVFRWYMQLIYHLQPGRLIWSPTSKQIVTARKFCSEFLFEKISLSIFQPSSDGGTTSTGNVARQCFLNKNNFVFHANTLVPVETREELVPFKIISLQF